MTRDRFEASARSVRDVFSQAQIAKALPANLARRAVSSPCMYPNATLGWPVRHIERLAHQIRLRQTSLSEMFSWHVW